MSHNKYCTTYGKTPYPLHSVAIHRKNYGWHLKIFTDLRSNHTVTSYSWYRRTQIALKQVFKCAMISVCTN